MCFILHMASKTKAPILPWNEAARGVWTEPAKEQNVPLLRSKFTFEHVTYVGSSKHCGCGFRHLGFQQGGWPEEWLIDDPSFDGSKEQPDHLALVAWLKAHFMADQSVELFGVWDGDFQKKAEHRATLEVSELENPRFRFRERGFYTVELSNRKPSV